MTSLFPTGVDSFVTTHQPGDTIVASTDNDQADAINKLESSLRNDGVRAATYFGLSTSSDNTSAWDNNVVPWMQAGGGTLQFGRGTWVLPPLTGTRALYNFVNLRGVGRGASVIQLASGSNADFITCHQSTGSSDPYGRIITVENLTVDGNKANQSAGRGIWFSVPAPDLAVASDYYPDGEFTLRNIEIKNTKGDGCGNTGASDMLYSGVWCHDVDGHGFIPSYDSKLQGCTAGGAGLNGFYLAGGSGVMANCKAFYSGRLQVDTDNGIGFYFVNTGLTGGFAVSSIVAQDNGSMGIAFVQCRHVEITSAICDSNGWGRNGALATPGTYSGMSFWDSQYCMVKGYTSFDRLINHGAGARVTQSHAISLDASGAGVGHHLYVEGTHAGMIASQDASMGTAAGTYNKTNVVNSTIVINGATL
jgi:hypothetical protein